MLSKYCTAVAFFSALFISAVAAAPTPDVVSVNKVIPSMARRDINDGCWPRPDRLTKSPKTKNEKQDTPSERPSPQEEDRKSKQEDTSKPDRKDSKPAATSASRRGIKEYR